MTCMYDQFMFFFPCWQPYRFWQLSYVKGEVTVDKCSELQFLGLREVTYMKTSLNMSVNFHFLLSKIIDNLSTLLAATCAWASLSEPSYKTLQPWGLISRGPKMEGKAITTDLLRSAIKVRLNPHHQTVRNPLSIKKCTQFVVKHIINFH